MQLRLLEEEEVVQQPLRPLLAMAEEILELEFLKAKLESRVDSVCGKGNWDINQGVMDLRITGHLVEANSSLKINLIKVYNSNNSSSNNIIGIRNNSQVVVRVQVLEDELLVSQEVVIKVLSFECHQIVIMVMNTSSTINITSKWPLIRVGGPRCQLLTRPVVILMANLPRPR